jgi:hypothetical protein
MYIFKYVKISSFIVTCLKLTQYAEKYIFIINYIYRAILLYICIIGEHTTSSPGTPETAVFENRLRAEARKCPTMKARQG